MPTPERARSENRESTAARPGGRPSSESQKTGRPESQPESGARPRSRRQPRPCRRCAVSVRRRNHRKSLEYLANGLCLEIRKPQTKLSNTRCRELTVTLRDYWLQQTLK